MPVFEVSTWESAAEKKVQWKKNSDMWDGFN